MNKVEFLNNLKYFCDAVFTSRQRYQSRVDNDTFQIQTQFDGKNRVGTLTVYDDFVDGQTQYIVAVRMKEYRGYSSENLTVNRVVFRYVFDINGRRIG